MLASRDSLFDLEPIRRHPEFQHTSFSEFANKPTFDQLLINAPTED